MKELIKEYQTRLNDILIFHEVGNIYDISNVKSRTVAEVLKGVIYDLEQLTKQQ